jgi:hypothetical protein
MNSKEAKELLELKRKHDAEALWLAYLIVSDDRGLYQWSNVTPMLRHAKRVINQLIKYAELKEKEANK